jgi:hypothetical protein
MALWKPEYPVAFRSDGDYTFEAIGKHIEEIDRIYEILNYLRGFTPTATPPSEPEENDIWLNPETMELMLYKEGHGWESLLTVYRSRVSDNASKLGGIPAGEYALLSAVTAIQDALNQLGQDSSQSLSNLQDYVDEQIATTLSTEAFVFKGEWEDGGGYVPYNVVEYEGSSYILRTGDGLTPPPQGGWQLVAQKGREVFLGSLSGGRADTVFIEFVDGGGAEDGAH